MTNMPGGFTDPMDATEEIQKICDQVSFIQKNTKKVYEEFRAVKYTSQVVNGTNYLIKVHVGGHIYLHLKVYQSLIKTWTLINLSQHITLTYIS
uniref:Cystatin-B n=1 Tax=Seriola lalandi dorsalis TaxID=1841481 RepID=A0A3B4WK10_SERLL